VIFVSIVLVVWMIFVICLRRRMSDRFRFSNALLPLVLTSYLVAFDLGTNYVAGAIPVLNDGIGLHSKFAYYIIGEDGWSLELFKRIYDYSFTISIILTLLYIGALFLTPKRSH